MRTPAQARRLCARPPCDSSMTRTSSARRRSTGRCRRGRRSAPGIATRSPGTRRRSTSWAGPPSPCRSQAMRWGIVRQTLVRRQAMRGRRVRPESPCSARRTGEPQCLRRRRGPTSSWDRRTRTSRSSIPRSGSCTPADAACQRSMSASLDAWRELRFTDDEQRFTTCRGPFGSVTEEATMPTTDTSASGEGAPQVPEFEDVLYEVEDTFAVITINRPGAFNAFRSQTVDELIEAFTFAWGDTRVRSIILTGAGEKAFCAGGDVKQKAATGDYGPSKYGMFRVSELHKLIREVPKPVLAAVNGVAVGGGHVLHVVCDISYAAEHARFGQAGPKVGSFDAGFGTAFLARVVGEKRAREIWYFTELMDADKAERWGLVNAVVPGPELLDYAKERARLLCRQSPTALRFLKQSFNADSDHQAGFTSLAMSALDLYQHSPESHEGAAAFAEKRDADFSPYVNGF